MKDNITLGACGLYCGACYHYLASFPEHKHLLETAKRKGYKLDGYTCKGCWSGDLYTHPGCSQCQIRECAELKDILYCGQCSDFPCGRLKSFQCDGRIHHLDVLDNLNEVNLKGIDQWLSEQDNRWRCPCGFRFSWYENLCQNCELLLNSYGSKLKSS